MRQLRSLLPGKQIAQRLDALLFCALIIFAASTAVQAQSGRHIRKRDKSATSPAAAPTEPQQTTKPSPSSPAPPRLSILVGSYKYDPSMNHPLSFHDIILEGCLERFRQSSALTVALGGEMNRKEAIERAKSEKETYVMWLELGVESDLGGTADASIGHVNPRRLFVNYVVFTPGTAKVKTQGRVFQDTYRAGMGNIGIGVPTPTRRITRTMPIQCSLRQAGFDTADRVMSNFYIPLPKQSNQGVCGF